MWETAGEEGAELDEIVDGYAVLFGLRMTSVALLCVLRLVVGPGCFHRLALVLLWQSILLLFLLELGHVLL